MRAVQTVMAVVVYVAVVIGLAIPANGGAPWFRDFNDGTLQELQEFDYAWVFGIDGFDPTNVDNAARLLFKTGDDTDTAVLYDNENIFTDTTVKMLIKWPTNPLLIKDGTPAMNVGLFMRATIDLMYYQFQAYIALMTDEGEMLLVKLNGFNTPDLCPTGTGGDTVLENFDPSVNWWLRGEVTDVPEGVRVRARAWPEGTPEPEIWHVECVDTPGGLYPLYWSGGTGIGAQEEDAADLSNGLSYVDVDDVSAGPAPEYKCFNLVDDDGDGLIDCADADCAAAPACACHDPFADADGDGDVDQADFAVFQACLTGEAGGLGVGCDCFDRDDANSDGFFNPPDDGDEDVDNIDLDKFEVCASGPGIAADTTCDNLNY